MRERVPRHSIGTDGSSHLLPAVSSSIKDHCHQALLPPNSLHKHDMDPTSTCLPKHKHLHLHLHQHHHLQQPFTFATPISSQTYQDAVDFDYRSWIEQSKISNGYSSQDHSLLGMPAAEAEAILHREMMLQAVDSLPEEAYELSLRDITDLSLSRAAASTEEATSSTRTPSNHRPWRNKTPSMEGAGLIIKLFMPSPSRDAAASSRGRGRRKSFSISTVPALRKKSASVNHCCRENAASEMENEPTNTRSNDRTSRKSHQDTTNRKSMGCYPFFTSRKHRVNQVAGGHFCL